MITKSEARPGMDIVVTKSVGIEGTSIIAKEKERELKQHFPSHMIDRAKALEEYIPVLEEKRIAADNGASAMHNVAEGGILGALWEMAEASGVGVDVQLSMIPVKQETIEICEYYNINPYKLISGGCILIATDDERSLIDSLELEGVPAAVIGKFTKGADRIVHYDDNIMYLTPPDADELFNVI